MKVFYTGSNIGKAKYTVHNHDGVQTHKDGSAFFGIAIFKNKKKLNAYIKSLIQEGYEERDSFYSCEVNA